MAADREIIEASLLFDGNWYLQRYPDVAKAGADPLHHYLTVGWHEGRDPGPTFTTAAYLKANEDVARSGVNPLLHFVQFGLAEGREGFGNRHLPPVASEPSANFAPPHECLSFPRSRPAPSIWRRGYRLDRGNPRFIAIGDAGAGYASDRSGHAEVQGGVEWLRLLSGFGPGDLPRQDPPARPLGQWLVDGWYVNAAQLRTRWDGENLPLVVRAFQCDPVGEGEPRLVGEGAMASPLDFVDLHLVNPYFPILFALAAPDGTLRGIAMLTFPSLCRGGTHYPELVWASGRSASASLDVAAASEELSRTLIALIRGEAQAAVEQIQVDLAAADGNGPLFRSDLSSWLAKVLQVDVGASDPTNAGGSAPPIVQSHSSTVRIVRDGGGALLLSPDAAPTIAALVAHRTNSDRLQAGRPVPLLASHLDPSKRVVSIDVPSGAVPALESLGSHLPWLRPNREGVVPTDFPAAAIRASSAQELSDAQLLVPLSNLAPCAAEQRAAVTWLIHPDEWDDKQLIEGIQTLALQRSAAQDTLAIVGPSTNAALAHARKLFPGEVVAFRTRGEAVLNLKTTLAGCVAGGMLLHNSRTADCFSSVLSNDRISTVSCVIVSAEKRGGAIQTAIIDPGALARPDGAPATPAEGASAAVELWQGSYPVLRPSPFLWASRSERLASWPDGLGEGDTEVHLCLSAVTAALAKKGATAPYTPDVPQASETGTRVEWLVG